jgi:hypothetical protein
MLVIEVGQLGLWNLFDHFLVVDLHYFASKINLKIQSNNKQIIIGAITSGVDYIDANSHKNNVSSALLCFFYYFLITSVEFKILFCFF